MAEGGMREDWYSTHRSGRIRPKPNVALRKGAKFAMCNGTTCRGENCTFAHSPEEMRVWNSQLSADFDEPSIMPEQQSPFVLDENDFPSISHTPPYFGPATSNVKQWHSSSPWQSPGINLQQNLHGNDWPAMSYSMNINSIEPSFIGQVSGSFPSASYQSNSFKSEISKAFLPGLDAFSTIPTSKQPTSSYVPQLTASTMYPPRQPTVQVAGQASSAFPARLTSRTSVRFSNLQGAPGSVTQLQASSSHAVNTSALEELTFSENLDPSILYSKLSAENYVKKFKRLVEVEKIAHEGILRERCNGDYKLLLLPSFPMGIKIKHPENYQQYAQLENISADNLAYVRQTCTSVTLSTRSREEYKADILDRMNKRLAIAFKKGAKIPPQKNLKVTFNLKESYFTDLLRSVNNLSSSMVGRIMPTSGSFDGMPVFADVHMFESYCSSEQLEALNTLATCPSSGPPILLMGPFGTGKSRLLALAVHYFQTLQTQRQPIRILVCTQQRVSADKFLEYYDQLWVDVKKGSCYLIREYAVDEVKASYQHYCKSSKEFERIWKSSNCDNLVLITTCLTAPHLSFLPRGFFTHILIDEGSMMREPEAVAPLFLANDNTKIILAGDPNQVGPAILVLGDLAKSNGMSISLLQRLEKLYKCCGGDSNIATLSINYRCHPAILELVGNLFYDGKIKWNKEEPPPATHRNFQYPLVFVCSSIEEDVTSSSDRDENEANAIYQKVGEAAKGCPSSWAKHPTSDFFVISPTEEQVYFLRNKFKNISGMAPEIKSSISIQGREFQAIFISTAELLHEDGSSRNPLRSLCDPYIFNTAITRAKSLVVCVGNPFHLLKIEKKMVQFYSQEHNANCWSSYLHLCLQHNTFEFAQNLKLSIEQKANILAKLRSMVENVNPEIHKASDVQSREDMQRKIQNLESQLKALTMKKTSSEQSVGGFSDMNHLGDVSLASTPFFPITIDPNTGSTFPPGFSYSLYNPSVVASENLPAMTVPHELTLISPPQASNNKPPSPTILSYLPPAGIEDIEETEISTTRLDSYFSGATVKNDNSHTAYSDVQRVSPQTTDSAIGTWSLTPEVHTHQLLYESDAILGNGRAYSKEGKLGNGGFGVVYHVVERNTGNNYALKVVRLPENELLDRHKTLREVEALKKLNHDHIVHYEDHWIEEACSKEWWGKHERTQYRSLKPCLFILTELCESMTLKDWLAKHSGENSRNRKSIIGFFEQIVNGLVFIHDNGCTHRDLKPSNIFFGRYEQDKLKIGDFGLVLIEQPTKQTADTSVDMERLSTYSTHRGGGTFPYMSPEQQEPNRKVPIECKTDIYSLGIILFELHYPKNTSEDERSLVFSRVRAGLFPVSFKERMPKVHDAVLKLTKQSPRHRPSAVEVQKHILVDLSTMNRKTRRSCVPVL